MRSLLQRLSWAADKALSVVIWLHDSVMLFICLFWLLPLIVLVVISAFIYEIRPILRDRMQEVFFYSLLGLPVWIRRLLYAQFPEHQGLGRRMPAYVGYVLLGVGGLLWLLGIIWSVGWPSGPAS